MKLDYAELGKRRYLAKAFQDIVRIDKRFRNMGNTLQSTVIETINYYFRYGDVQYTSEKKMMKFKQKITMADEVFDLSFQITEDELQRGFM